MPGFTDDPEEQQATATLIQDDQIDFLDPESRVQDYQDDFSENEDDVFRHGDGNDEVEAINLDRQPSQR